MNTPTDNTDSLEAQLLACYREYKYSAQALLIKKLAAISAADRDKAVRAALVDLRGWIDRIHYQPVNESDRWVQAAGEIIAEIDNRIKLQSDTPAGGKE